MTVDASEPVEKGDYVLFRPPGCTEAIPLHVYLLSPMAGDKAILFVSGDPGDEQVANAIVLATAIMEST
jgi:hypothetical protein